MLILPFEHSNSDWTKLFLLTKEAPDISYDYCFSAYSSYSIAVWLGVCGLADHVEHEAWLGKHRHVAAVALKGGCAHALGEEALQIGMNGSVLFGDDVPARLRLPGSSPDFRLEQIGVSARPGLPKRASA